MDFPSGSEGKASAYSAGDLGSIPGLGRSPGEGNGDPLQYSCLEIPWTEEPGGLQSRVEKSRTRLSDFTSLHIYTDEVFSLKTEISVLSTILTVGF